MKKVLTFLLLAWFQSGSWGSTVYSLVTDNYTTPTGAYTTAMHISGSFTTASPLPPNMPLTPIGPLGSNLAVSWSFSDGVNTFTNANSMEMYGQANKFQVSTDATGKISGYAVDLMTPLPPNTTGQMMNAMVVDGPNNLLQAVINDPCQAVNASNVCTNLLIAGESIVNQHIGPLTTWVAPVSTPSTSVAVNVPTLTEWGVMVLSMLMLAAALGSGRQLRWLRNL